MIGILADWWKTKRARQRAALREAEVSEHMFSAYDDLANLYFDRDMLAAGQRRTGPEAARKRVSLDLARAESRDFARNNAHARNIVFQTVNFTVGAGFGISFEDDAVAKQWHEDARALNWWRRRREIVRRIPRDGETILRRFGTRKDRQNGVDLRFVEPGRIKTPTGKDETDGVIDGVKVAVRDSKLDVEAVEGYYIDDELVDAAEVFTFRDPFCDANDVRGWPLLYDAIPIIDRYERWVNVRAILNEARASITLFRKHKRATPAQLQTFADGVKAGSFTRLDQQSQRYAQKPMPGTVFDHTDDIEYEFKSPNVDARDVRWDGRAMRLLIAAFFSMPEYWVTADASNANLASTLVAENPGIQAMLSWQDFMAAQFTEFLNWWFGEPVEVRFVFPNLVLRQPYQEVQALAIEHDHGIISRQTWQERRRYDPVAEQERIAVEGSET